MEALDFGEPRQNGFDYPLPLVEKYQPRKIEDFIGLEGPKQLFANLLKAPRPVAVLLVGPPGCGKTTLAMAFSEELPGTLHHVSSQKCDVAALDRLNDVLSYYPSRGQFHVVKVDEADQMTDKAQLQLLSRLDGTASLKPRFGGGWERGNPASRDLDFHLQWTGRGRHDPTEHFRAALPEPLPGSWLRKARSRRDCRVLAAHLVAGRRGPLY